MSSVEVLFWGFMTFVFLEISILAHEFGHSIAAQKLGYRIEKIVLYIFGGAALLEEDPNSANDEFIISISGPIVSGLLSVVFLTMHFLLGGFLYEPLSSFFLVMFSINAILLIFNVLIPIFPMDGGRILRSIIWKITDNYVLASKIPCLTFIFVIPILLFSFSMSIFSLFVLGVIVFLSIASYPKYKRDYIYFDEAYGNQIDASKMRSSFYILFFDNSVFAKGEKVMLREGNEFKECDLSITKIMTPPEVFTKKIKKFLESKNEDHKNRSLRLINSLNGEIK